MVGRDTRSHRKKASRPGPGRNPPHRHVPIDDLVAPPTHSSESETPLPGQIADDLDPRITDYVVGARFKNAAEEWIRDDTFRYTARVVTEAIQFGVTLAMKLQDSTDEKVEEIACDLDDVARNYQLEVRPWIKEFVDSLNFGYLISSVVKYSAKSVLRAKMLGSLKEKGYVTLEKCEEEGGGISIYVHPRDAVDEIYFKVQWSVRFVTKYWNALHFFSIHPVQADPEFVAANRNLLKTFCKVGVDEDELQELWNKLCLNIERHKQ